MVTRIILVFLFTIGSFLLFGSDCTKQTKTRLYEQADLIFVGKIMGIGDSSFSVDVHEIFKGDEVQRVDLVINESAFIPKERGEIWLFYARLLDGNLLVADQCGGSKSFSFPYGLQDISFPEPPPRGASEEMLQLFKNNRKQNSINELYFEILSLRQFRIISMLSSIDIQKSAHSNNEDEDNSLELIQLLLIAVIMLNVFLLIIIFRRNR